MAHVRDRRDADWFWMNKSVIDDYGAKIGVHGIAIYALLAKCSNQGGHAIPSLRYISQQLNIGTSTVQKYLEVLVEHGLIERQRRWSEYGDCTSTEYILLTMNGKYKVGVSTADTPLPVADTPLPSENIPVSVENRQVYRQAIHGVSTADTEQDPSNKKDLEQKNPSVSTNVETSPPQGHKKKTEVQRRDYAPGFQAWWNAYPADRRVSKPQCFTVWMAQNLEPRAEELVEKLERLKVTTWNKPDPAERRFIKTALPYLNDGRYDDDLVPLEIGLAQAARSRLSDREYQTMLAGQRFEEKLNGRTGRAAFPGNHADVIDHVQYRTYGDAV